MTDELAARRAARQQVAPLDTIANLHGQLMAATADLGDALQALVDRGAPIMPAELQTLLEAN